MYGDDQSTVTPMGCRSEFMVGHGDVVDLHPTGLEHLARRADDRCSPQPSRLLTRRELPVNSAATGMSMLAHNFSCTRAEAELGYTRRPFEAAAQDAWDWFVGHDYVKALRPRTALAR